MKLGKCIEGEDAYFKGAVKAEGPGHCYSTLGVDEFGISQLCEYHFDKIFEDDVEVYGTEDEYDEGLW